MKRAFIAVAGSALSAVVGLGIGLLAASAYVWRYYPNDPDPVDFTIGAILLLVCVAVWLMGTALTLWFILRRPRRMLPNISLERTRGR